MIATEPDSLPLLGESESASAAVLWIDDDVDEACVRLLRLDGYRMTCATTGADAIAVARSNAYDAYIVDLHLPDMYGLSVVQRLMAGEHPAPVLVLTGQYTEPESEQLARRLGAMEFRRKPVSADELAGILRRMVAGTSRLKKPRPCDFDLRFGMVAASQAMRAVAEWIDRVGPTAMPALVTGETGTGKELVARALHARSPRANSPFVAVNCGAIPEALRESELFGHCRGAFTGAIRDRKGLIEQAHGGTLFLDEIGDIALPVQVELLRVVDHGEVRRVGDTRTKRVDVRIIAATNRSLGDDIRQGRFREDLYYRLAGARRHLPPLRERPEDIDALVAHWLPRMGAAAGRPNTHLTEGALTALRTHKWPGNARQLQHAVELAVYMANGDGVTEQDVYAVLGGQPPGRVAVPVGSSQVDDAQEMLAALEANRWNQARTARKLGISRSTLWRRLRTHGIQRGALES